MSNGIASTKGHLSSNGGLRGHSVGPYFPVVLSQIGTFDNLRQLVITPTGQVEVPSYELATALAEAWEERRANRDYLPAEPAYEYSGCLLNVQEDGTTNVWAGYPCDEGDCVGIYAIDADGIAVCLTDVADEVQAAIIIANLKELPL